MLEASNPASEVVDCCMAAYMACSLAFCQLVRSRMYV